MGAHRRLGTMMAQVALGLALVFLLWKSQETGFAAPNTPPAPLQQKPISTTGFPSTQTGSSSDTPMGNALLMFGLAATGGVAVALSRRKGRTACEAVGLLYASQTGNTETVAGYIAEAAGLEAEDVGDYGAEDLTGFDGLIVGCPTWNTGADENRSGTAWDDLLDEIKDIDLAGKPVAVFGCGDSQGYGDNFCDGIEEMHETFKAAGAKMVGYVSAGDYQHTESKSVRGDKFLGLPLDEDNENDLTDGRVEAWVAQIKSEGMPL